MADLCEYSDSPHSLFYLRNDFLSCASWYTLDLLPHSYAILACLVLWVISPCWQGCLHCCLRLLDCLSLPWNVMLLPYFFGSLNDIHFQRQCQHQRYVLASCRHTALMFWLILTSLLSRFLKHPITSLLWKILRVFSVTRTVEERQ